MGLGALALFILYGSSGPWADASGASELPGLSLPDLAQNVLLYLPFGVFGIWALRGLRISRSALTLSMIALAMAYSAVMELLQMWFADRIASPLDIVANVAGTVVGIALAGPAEQAWAMASAQLRRTGLLNTPARYVLGALLATIVVAAWYPFDITLDISTLSQRTRPVRLDPWLWPGTTAMWMHGAAYFLMAATLVFCLPKLSRWAVPAAVVVTVLIATIVDMGQLGMGSQPIGLAAFASQATGACCGAAAALLARLVRGTAYAAA